MNSWAASETLVMAQNSSLPEAVFQERAPLHIRDKETEALEGTGLISGHSHFTATLGLQTDPMFG